MAKQIATSIKYCEQCERKTVHMREARRINWLMHLVLTLVTLGLWVIVFAVVLILHPLTTPLGRKTWICQNCGHESNGFPRI